MSDITVIGAGYVGLVTGTCLSERGHSVIVFDIDAARIEALRRGDVPIHEPGLDDLVRRNTGAGRLRFVQTLEAGQAIIFIAVGTPPLPDGSADLGALQTVIDGLAANPGDGVIVIRSTVPPGTGDAMQARLAAAGCDATVVNAPEFLAEGTAVRDFMHPDRVVVGGPTDAAKRVADLFPDAPRFLVDRPTAEMAKYAANTFLAARVSLINEVANLCDAVGADVDDVAQIVGSDPRIGPKFLRPGIGYGGSCFPKDVTALTAVAQAHGLDMPVAAAAQETNARQAHFQLDRVAEALGGLKGKRLGFWGIAFKPGTDDTREAPGLRMMAAAKEAGAIVIAHDPVARAPAGIEQAPDAVAAVEGADALLLVTEWPEYQDIRPADVADAMRGDLAYDGRNALDIPAYTAAGLRILGVGRRP